MYSRENSITKEQIRARAEDFIQQFRCADDLAVEDMATELGIDPRNQLDLAAYITAYEFLLFHKADGKPEITEDEVVEVLSPKYEGYAGAAFMAHSKSAHCCIEFVRSRLGDKAASELEEELEADEESA